MALSKRGIAIGFATLIGVTLAISSALGVGVAVWHGWDNLTVTEYAR